MTAENTPSTSRPPSPTTNVTRSAQVPGSFDSGETASFVRKVLCPGKSKDASKDGGSPTSLDQLLPPLTSSNDVDLQLYAFIAVIINDNVTPWYSRTTTDSAFIEEIVHIIAHCTRGLEERLRKTDLIHLLFDEVASLLIAHIQSKKSKSVNDCLGRY